MSRPDLREHAPDLPDGRVLMQAVADDEPGAFARLVQVYEGRVRATVLRYVSDTSSVEDLAQEVFLRIYRSRHRYVQSARFETFLHRIVYNLCVNFTQHRGRRRALSLDAPRVDGEDLRLTPADETSPDPHANLERDELARLVREAVARLPDSQRQALMLNRFDGLSYEDVGQVMDLSVPAVKSLLWRARENVRKTLLPHLAPHLDPRQAGEPGDGPDD